MSVSKELLSMCGNTTRRKQIPAWALVSRSPFKNESIAKSWIGGQPSAAKGLDWPRDTKGHALHFLAQIDLSELKPDLHLGDHLNDIPKSAVLLTFFGEDESRCILVNLNDLVDGQFMSEPDDLSPLNHLWFFTDKKSFKKWSIDCIPYMDEAKIKAPKCLKGLGSPHNWINNWGMAALESKIVLHSLNIELQEASFFFKNISRRALPDNDSPVIASKKKHYAILQAKAPALIDILTAWYYYAEAQPKSAKVDEVRLAEVIKERMTLCDVIVERYPSKLRLPCNPIYVWQEITTLLYPGVQHGDYNGVPEVYHNFIEKNITSWRGHRLFGVEPPFPNNFDDLRNQDCIISIAADAMLGTKSEHEYGLSIWGKSSDISVGKFDNTKLVRHCAV